MKKTNRKGFTIVELVIVIAVIAILAAVLIPTFSNIVSNAKASAFTQEARNTYTNGLVNEPSMTAAVIKLDDDSFAAFKDGKLVMDTEKTEYAKEYATANEAATAAGFTAASTGKVWECDTDTHNDNVFTAAELKEADAPAAQA